MATSPASTKADAVEAREERREERAQRVHVEVVQGARQDQPPHGRDREDDADRASPAAAVADGVGLRAPAPRLREAQRGHSAEQAGQRRRRRTRRASPSCGPRSCSTPKLNAMPMGRPSMKTERALARRCGRKRSPMSEEAAGAQVASPTPTPRRTTKSDQKLRATPEGGEQAPDEHARGQDARARRAVRQAAQRHAHAGVEEREGSAQERRARRR